VEEVAPRRLEIEVPYKPRNWALPFHDSLKRWAAIVLHRRAGKTTATLNHHQRAATNDAWERERLKFLEPKFTESELDELLQHRQYGHILPLLGQAKSVAWEPLKRIAEVVPGATTNESELSVKYKRKPKRGRVFVPMTGDLNPDANSTSVRLFGADNPDAFRGLPFSGVSYDEYSQHPPNIHGEVVSKALADHLGYGIFEGTIKGKNQLFRTYEAAKHDPDWFALWQDVDKTLATEDGATITAIRRSMADDLKQIASGLMLQSEYDQEWFLSPSAAIKGAYYGKLLEEAIKAKRVGSVPYDPALPVFDVWDLGKGPRMSVGMFQRFGRQVSMIDYHQGIESDGIPQVVAKLKERPYVWGKHFAPHDVRATDIGTGKTRLETAASLGWPFEIVPEMRVDDGINAGRLLFPRLWVDEQKCQQFLDAIGQYRQEWDDKRGMFRDTPLHDWTSHPADMFRYAAAVEDQMVTREKRESAPSRIYVPTGPDSWMG
jgi:pterin-4a-carbinolamine dehydratase